ncbi:MAG: hypothetical protein D6723_03055 [Acidobacteria bacterium]|nr:MAG: hypothetical protein D6723_03055 [Acidobacteriota bacterium]
MKGGRKIGEIWVFDAWLRSVRYVDSKQVLLKAMIPTKRLCKVRHMTGITDVEPRPRGRARDWGRQLLWGCVLMRYAVFFLVLKKFRRMSTIW